MKHNYPVEIFGDYQDFFHKAREFMTEQEVVDTAYSSESMGLPRPVFARESYVIVYVSDGVYGLMRNIPPTELERAKREMSHIFNNTIKTTQEDPEFSP